MNIKELDTKYICPTYKRSVAFKYGKNATLYDFEGNKYIDFTSGIGVNIFGHQDQGLIEAITTQANMLMHTSNLYYTEPQALLAKELCEKSGMKKVFFANSGAEANEGAIKAARKYSMDKYGPNRYEIITLKESFHGRTMASLTATGQDKFHEHFNPFLDGFKYAEKTISSIQSLISSKTCAIMIETIQGEGGVNPLSEEFIIELYEICNYSDILLIIDEVQTGNGRTGYLYSYMKYNILPDIVTTAKGLAGGLPMGAILFNDKTENVFNYSDHGSTFGGNPVCAAAALNVIERLDKEFLKNVLEKEKIIRQMLTMENVKVSGSGLMLGVSIEGKTNTEIQKQCLDHGLIVLTAGNKIRLLPPLTISNNELIEGLYILKEVILG